jgi:N-methylhydantoinase A
LRREISERVDCYGRVKTPIVLEDVIKAVHELVEKENIEALSICFLNSYANPENEQLAADMVQKEYQDLYISASNDVFPFMREYERWTTTSMNAYVQPAVDRYIGKLEKSLEDQHFVGRFYVMTSSGGMVATQTARKYPIRLLESGPAAGAIMSAYHGRMTGADSVLSFDMGGTTAKGALIRGGQPLKTYETEVARVHEFKAGSGLPAKAPSIDMIEIGSGGEALLKLMSEV